ncbi:bacteriohemerythrin [Parazoarcus communis]|nr:bacteriohemerythrin [Parazoarcus communis]
MSTEHAASGGPFIWADYFETGLGEVDEQHFKLVGLVNQLGARLATGRSLSAAELDHVMDGLGRYAILHFRTEEEMMKARGIDRRHFESHCAAHAEFVAQIDALAAAIASGQGSVLTELLRYVSSWLALHILGIDMSMSRQLHAMEKGVSAADAYDQDATAADPANRALVSAVHTLYTTVAERNAELIKAKAELEQRVAERTADLQDAVRHLEAAKEEIVQSEKMAALGQFAAGMAHELNTPLGYIGGNLNALGSYCEQLVKLSEEADRLVADGASAAAWNTACERADRDFVREDAPQLLTESRAGLERIHRIVEALRCSAGGAEEEPKPTELHRIIDEVLLTYKASAPTEVEFDVSCEANAVAMVSPRGLAVAIDEMLDNAVKAVAGKGGVVRCSTGCSGGLAWLEIADTGPGINSAIAQHVFEPFFTTRAVGSGAGLGLYLAYQTARQHHGYIELRNTGPGAVFRLVLPALGAEGARA